MTYEEYDSLFDLLMQAQFSDPPPDEQVRRHITGLLKAILKCQMNRRSTQARIGSPRRFGLASTSATLDKKET